MQSLGRKGRPQKAEKILSFRQKVQMALGFPGRLGTTGGGREREKSEQVSFLCREFLMSDERLGRTFRNPLKFLL